MRHRRILPALLSLTLTLAFVAISTGCGSNPDSSSASAGATEGEGSQAPGAFGVTKDPKIAALVPQQFAKKGSVTVATSADYPPLEFIAADGKTIVGLDPDLGKALGAMLGLEFTLVNIKYDTLIPGMAAGKYDIGMAGIGILPEREKVVDFVSDLRSASSFITRADGGREVTDIASVCGLKVAVLNGTGQQEDLNAQNRRCKRQGDAPNTLLAFKDQQQANLALASQRADVGLLDAVAGGWAVKQSNGQFKLTGKTFHSSFAGIAIVKGNGLLKPIQAALQKLIDTGIYAKIFAKWGAGAITVDEAVIYPRAD
jgi:polar amino acid transport system substrate-binding protein